MQLPPQINFIGVPTSDAIDASIRKYLEKLERICNDIIGCRVAVEAEGKHKHKGRQYKVSIDLSVPGDEIVVNSVHMDPDRDDAHSAVRHAFEAATRQLEEYVQRRRGDIKIHPTPS
jgi:ribosome-associated translation inhibitor RaiA